MTLSDELHALVVALAKANGHPAPLDYADKVKEEFEPPVAPPPPAE